VVIASVGGFIVGAILFNVFDEGIIAATRVKLQDYMAGEGTRALIYTELVNDIVNEPLGIGKGRFVETNNLNWQGESVYPHQNLLGIGAELGVPAMLLFAGFVVTAIVVLARFAWARSQTIPCPLKMIAAVGLAMFLYQQFRGLFQDTWIFRETYFWLGLAVSVTGLRHASSAVRLEPARP
jgi:O-antigen ligase